VRGLIVAPNGPLPCVPEVIRALGQLPALLTLVVRQPAADKPFCPQARGAVATASGHQVLLC